jgi:hypothetical protein
MLNIGEPGKDRKVDQCRDNDFSAFVEIQKGSKK